MRLLTAAMLFLAVPTLVRAMDAAEPYRLIPPPPSEITPSEIKPATADSLGNAPPIFISPQETPRFGSVAVPSLSLALLRVYPLPDSLDPMEKAIAGFPEFWAKLEKENDIDDLRAQLGMGRGQWYAHIPITSSGGQLNVNLLGAGMSLYGLWRDHRDAKTREERLLGKINGLIAYTRELRQRDRKSEAPALEIILAKLHFMGERVGSSLPKRYDRKVFTENLKAWAVNPAFDTTLLGPGLMELCRVYEDWGP